MTTSSSAPGGPVDPGDVAVVGFAQTAHRPVDAGVSEVALVREVVADVLEQTGIDRGDIGFTVSGSLDYLAGAPFSFVSALDALGAWPPISESHVEMDAAWALYEAWLVLRHGGVDCALVYGFGKATQGDLAEILGRQLDPYYLAPLGVDADSLAALQAQALLDTGRAGERDLAEVAARSRAAALANPAVAGTGGLPPPPGPPGDDQAPGAGGAAPAGGAPGVGASPGGDTVVHPLRAAEIAPPCDGAAAVLLATGRTAHRIAAGRGLRPVWIRGLEHRIDVHAPGARDLTRVESAELAAAAAGVGEGPVDVAELHARYAHEEILLRTALGLGDGVDVNPSGGPLGADPVMATGLIRIGEVARRIAAGTAERGVAHAAQGPCLQHNLVAVLEAAP
ncbi:lipid-transfer protein [Nocardiopsis mangrovi]|uniref:Lipid-transfer protein n=1 Tax=Nocardiopsis mangrovi TaxID=1179818 RepID=A0ABV9DT95_9ACTN